MSVVNDFMGDMFGKVVSTAADLMQKVGCKTLLVHDIAAAVWLEMKGELQVFAMTRGLQALTLVTDSYGLDMWTKEKLQFVNTIKKTKM